MDNATEQCHLTYASLVPKLGSDEAPVDLDLFTVYGSIADGKYFSIIIVFVIC